MVSCLPNVYHFDERRVALAPLFSSRIATQDAHSQHNPSRIFYYPTTTIHHHRICHGLLLVSKAVPSKEWHRWKRLEGPTIFLHHLACTHLQIEMRVRLFARACCWPRVMARD